MRKQFTKILIVFSLFASINVKADEGMWLMMLIERLNYVDMQKMGLKLSPDELYSANNSSLKDAIVKFGRGCTGEMVSEQGLLMTAHHCGFEYIQQNSTVEKDYLLNGFWATSRAEELPCQGLTVTFLSRIEDVSEKVLLGVNESMTETSRKNKIDAAISHLVETATKKTNYTAEIKSFYEGKEYYMFVYETFKDIRLVGAPPQAVGNFGGDTDNWAWPRHTGDFSMFRVYTAPDGTAAEYSKDNVPFKPKHFLPISTKGVKEGDFTMSIGYPGKTDRFISSYGVNIAEKQYNPAFVRIRDKKLSIMRASMESSYDNKLKYAAKYVLTSNYWKFYQEQTKNIQRLNIYDKKKAEENTFQKWADSDPTKKAMYGNTMKDIADAYKEIEKYNLSKLYFSEVIGKGVDLMMISKKFLPLYKQMSTLATGKDKKKLMDDARILAENLKEDVREYIKNTDFKTDKLIFRELFKLYYNDIVKEQHPDIFQTVEKEYLGDMGAFADYVYNNSIFADPNKLWFFLNHIDAQTLEGDITFKILNSCMSQDAKIDGAMLEANWKLTKAKRTYIEGLKEMNVNKKFYPDANSTMRLNYGKVSGYIPSDGLVAEYRTTLDGILEKEDKNNDDFNVPDKLKLIHQYKDYGQYGENNEMPICFITDNDVTGGNSGGPVINGEGQLVGIVFDLNREAMSADYCFSPTLQRTIAVDIRYPLLIMDKMFKASYILNELQYNK
ncbi:MAG: S46 family peptidase [Bacteroidota bacterium]